MWRQVLGQCWHEKTGCRPMGNMETPENLCWVHQMTTKWFSTCETSLVLLMHKPNNTAIFGLKLPNTDGQADKCKCSWPPGRSRLTK